MGLRPAHNRDGRAVQKHAGRRSSPDQLFNKAIGAISGVTDAVTVQVKGAVIAPVITPVLAGPFQVAGADILHLVLILDEGVFRDFIAFGTGGVVHPDLGVLNQVAGDFVEVGVVEKNAFLGPVHDIVGNSRLLGGVEHQALMRAIDADVFTYRQELRKHQGISNVIADGDIAADFAVIGVHVVHRIAQLGKAVMAKDIVAAGIGKNPVATPGDIVVQNA